MKNYALKVAILFCAIIMFTKCTPEEEVTSSACDFTDAESNTYYNTAMKFANNPTKGTCNVLKQSSLDLIKKFERCDAATKAQITQLTQQWKSIDCNSF